MTTERTPLGRELETALREVLAHMHSEIDLPCRSVIEETSEPDPCS